MVTVAVPSSPGVHRWDLLLWHGLSAACMALMLVAALPAWLAGGAVAVFAVGVAWCTGRAVLGVPASGRAAYLRLGVCCLAMVAMLLPVGGQVAAGAAASPSAASTAGHTMAGHAIAGHAMAGHAMAGGSVTTPGPGVVAVLLATVLVCLALSGAVRGVRAWSSGGRHSATLVEALLATGMAAMLVGAR
jgi:hypothetical protein